MSETLSLMFWNIVVISSVSMALESMFGLFPWILLKAAIKIMAGNTKVLLIIIIISGWLVFQIKILLVYVFKIIIDGRLTKVNSTLFWTVCVFFRCTVHLSWSGGVSSLPHRARLSKPFGQGLDWGVMSQERYFSFSKDSTNSSWIAWGLALPLDSFMTWPTKKANNLSFPDK